MIYEVAAAVDHIVALIQGVERDQPVASEALAGFASTLKDALEKRCQKCWKPAEPEWGSAQRSVTWQLHAAGEGADQDLLRAFASVVQAHAQEGEIIHPHQSKVLALALQWLPLAFTLWIDPGCVAVRNGPGPGASRFSYDFDHLASAPLPSSIHVVWGHMVAHTADRQAPQLTVSGVSRPIPIVQPTPTVGLARYPVHTMSNARPMPPAHHHHHHRALSTSSSTASSSCHGLVRSASLSSTHTASTDATSLSGHESESEACPSLCSPSSSSLPSSQCTPCTDNDSDSVYDTTVGDTTERFAGVRLFGDEDDDAEQGAGDVTINAGHAVLGLNLAKPHMLGASLIETPVQPAIAAPAKPPVASAPVKCNYTTHDNGNVGVLGGGVRLGGSSVKSTQPPQPPRYRQHSNSKSISHLQNGLHNQLLPAYMPRRQEHTGPHPFPRQLHHVNAANYSAPMRTVPLPPAGAHHLQALPSHLGFQQQPHQQQYNAPPTQGPTMVPFGARSQPPLPMPYGFRTPGAQQQQQQPQPQSFAHYAVQPTMAVGALTSLDGVGEQGQGCGDRTGAGMGRRRLRSRGRRSRGRGAGRAARRQAAALRALELGSTEELPEFDSDDDDDDDDLISRCSTPATDTASSCYESISSSPAKPAQQTSKPVVHRSSHTNLGSSTDKGYAIHHHPTTQFTSQLLSNLARLQSS